MDYKILKEIAFNGDLSLEDASLLVSYGIQSSAILEFGSGGSTQIFAQCMPQALVSVETSSHWAKKTHENIKKLDRKTPARFFEYGLYPKDDYDLVFVDGLQELRREFAIDSWPLLNPGGVMIFHDTRRFEYFQDAAWVAQLYFYELDRMDVNIDGSNLTILHKCKPKKYVNWNETENKPAWAYGIGESPGGRLWKIEN